MSIEETLNVKGDWLVSNCGDLPSEMGCKLVLMSPVDQREDLVTESVQHAIDVHGHENTPELRTQLDGMLKPMTIQKRHTFQYRAKVLGFTNAVKDFTFVEKRYLILFSEVQVGSFSPH